MSLHADPEPPKPKMFVKGLRLRMLIKGLGFRAQGLLRMFCKGLGSLPRVWGFG